MANRKVSDIDLLYACLQLYDADTFPSARNVATHLSMSPSSVHRRLRALVDEGRLKVRTVYGKTGYYLRPSALDLCGQFREGRVTMYWQVDGDHDLYISMVDQDF